MKRRILTSLMVFAFACASEETNPGTTGAGPTTSGGNTTGNPGSGGVSNTGTGGDGTGNTGGNSVGAGGDMIGAGGNPVGAGGNAMGGSSGVGGSGGNPIVMNAACGGLAPAQTSESVLTRGKNPQRTAHFIESQLTVAAVGSAKFGPDAAFNAAAKFTGNLESVPLFVAGATPGKGMFIVASKGANITAIDETTGATVWTKNVGAAGSGVRSTPVIDDKTGTIYMAFDATNGGNHHEIHALSIANMGAEVAGWPVNVANVKSTNNGHTFGTYPVDKMIQRGALSLVNGILYVPYGGVYGDGPPYKGFVVTVNVANPTMTGGWSAGGDRSGIWQSGGVASDGTSIFATTGNGSDGTHQDTEEVVRITGMGTSSNAAKDKFFPSNWKQWDGQDNDFSSSSPMVLSFRGQCNPLVVAPSKPGHLFFLDPSNLGGADGSTPLRDLAVGNPTANGEYKVFYAAPTGYISASGVHVALEARLDAKCPNGGGGDSLVSILVDMTTTPPTPKVAWCAAVAGGEDRHHPISTSTDGASNAIVWFVAGGALKAFNGETGAPLFSGTPCGNVQKQTAPIAANGRVIVGADGKLCSYSVQP